MWLLALVVWLPQPRHLTLTLVTMACLLRCGIILRLVAAVVVRLQEMEQARKFIQRKVFLAVLVVALQVAQLGGLNLAV
jgi:hypothetical protein